MVTRGPTENNVRSCICIRFILCSANDSAILATWAHMLISVIAYTFMQNVA